MPAPVILKFQWFFNSWGVLYRENHVSPGSPLSNLAKFSGRPWQRPCRCWNLKWIGLSSWWRPTWRRQNPWITMAIGMTLLWWELYADHLWWLKMYCERIWKSQRYVLCHTHSLPTSPKSPWLVVMNIPFGMLMTSPPNLAVMACHRLKTGNVMPWTTPWALKVGAS